MPSQGMPEERIAAENTLGHLKDASATLLVQIGQKWRMFVGDDQYMPRIYRLDVHEGRDEFVPVYKCSVFISVDDVAENALCHFRSSTGKTKDAFPIEI